MDPGEREDFSGVLQAVRRGDPDAENLLFERVYTELHRLAQREMRREFKRPDLLQTTALVNEAWLRMAGNKPSDWKDRRYFFGAASRAMRRILVDHARRRQAARRGGGLLRVTLSGEIPGQAPAYDVLALHEVLERLAGIRPRAAQVVVLRFFGGMTVPETAEQLGISSRSVDSDWNFARRWLERTISERPDREPPPRESDAP